jgi:sugar lactone lactonase YvrE
MKKVLLKSVFLLALFIGQTFLVGEAFAQSITLDPANSGSNIVDIKSTNKGLLMPRVSSLPSSPTAGTVIYDATTNIMKYWNNSAWISLLNGGSGIGWTASGNNIYNSNSGNVGIGTNNPTQKLEVKSGGLNKSGIKITNLVGELSTGTSTKLFVNINQATGLAFDNSGNLYVTNFSQHKIHKVTPAGVISDFVTTDLYGPHDIVFGPDGNLYASNYYDDTVVKITLGGVVSFFGSGYSSPIGLTFDNSNNLYVVNNGTGAISKVNAAGTVVSHTFATGLTSPYNCVFDVLTNKIFISNYGANEVAQVNASTGGAITTFKAGISSCTGIVKDNAGNLYVAQVAPNSVSKITPSGDVSFYGSTTYPFDIAFDASGILYVANQTIDGVSKLSQTFNTLLAVNSTGEVTTTNLPFNKDGYKLYIDESVGGEVSGVFSETKNGNAFYGISTTGNGVGGTSESGSGLIGYSSSGWGVTGNSASGIGIYGSGGSYAGYFDGKVTVTGNFCAVSVACPSDIRLKRDFSPLVSSLTKLSNLKGYHYYWKDSTRSKNLQTGVIAQELQKIFPELVNQEKDGFLSVNYIGLIPHLLEAVKELRVINDELASKNELLLTELKKLKANDQQLNARLEAIEANLNIKTIK